MWMEEQSRTSHFDWRFPRMRAKATAHNGFNSVLQWMHAMSASMQRIIDAAKKSIVPFVVLVFAICHSDYVSRFDSNALHLNCIALWCSVAVNSSGFLHSMALLMKNANYLPFVYCRASFWRIRNLTWREIEHLKLTNANRHLNSIDFNLKSSNNNCNDVRLTNSSECTDKIAGQTVIDDFF